MKKWVLFIFVSFLLVGSVSSGAIYDIDFSEVLTHVVLLNESEVVRFDFPVRVYENRTFSTLEEKRNSPYKIENFEQKLAVRSVDAPRERTELTLYIYGAKTPQYFTLARDNMINVDFERDNIDDLAIGLYGMKGNQVAIILQKESIENKDTVKKGGGFWNNLKSKIDKKIIYYILGAIVILILIAKQKKIREYLAKE